MTCSGLGQWKPHHIAGRGNHPLQLQPCQTRQSKQLKLSSWPSFMANRGNWASSAGNRFDYFRQLQENRRLVGMSLCSSPFAKTAEGNQLKHNHVSYRHLHWGGHFLLVCFLGLLISKSYMTGTGLHNGRCSLLRDIQRIRGNSIKPHHRRFRQDSGRNFFTMRVVKLEQASQSDIWCPMPVSIQEAFGQCPQIMLWLLVSPEAVRQLDLVIFVGPFQLNYLLWSVLFCSMLCYSYTSGV